MKTVTSLFKNISFVVTNLKISPNSLGIQHWIGFSDVDVTSKDPKASDFWSGIAITINKSWGKILCNKSKTFEFEYHPFFGEEIFWIVPCSFLKITFLLDEYVKTLKKLTYSILIFLFRFLLFVTLSWYILFPISLNRSLHKYMFQLKCHVIEAGGRGSPCPGTCPRTCPSPCQSPQLSQKYNRKS